MFLLIVFVFLSIIVLGVPSWLEVIVDVLGFLLEPRAGGGS